MQTRKNERRAAYRVLQGRDEVDSFLCSLISEYLKEDRREEALWLTVIRKAWVDAHYGVKGSDLTGGYIRKTRREAVLFFTANNRWLEWATWLCLSAGIDVDWLRGEYEMFREVENEEQQRSKQLCLWPMPELEVT